VPLALAAAGVPIEQRHTVPGLDTDAHVLDPAVRNPRRPRGSSQAPVTGAAGLIPYGSEVALLIPTAGLCAAALHGKRKRRRGRRIGSADYRVSRVAIAKCPIHVSRRPRRGPTSCLCTAFVALGRRPFVNGSTAICASAA
jgi:hypothetical protein